MLGTCSAGLNERALRSEREKEEKQDGNQSRFNEDEEETKDKMRGSYRQEKEASHASESSSSANATTSDEDLLPSEALEQRALLQIPSDAVQQADFCRRIGIAPVTESELQAELILCRDEGLLRNTAINSLARRAFDRVEPATATEETPPELRARMDELVEREHVQLRGLAMLSLLRRLAGRAREEREASSESSVSEEFADTTVDSSHMISTSDGGEDNDGMPCLNARSGEAPVKRIIDNEHDSAAAALHNPLGDKHMFDPAHLSFSLARASQTSTKDSVSLLATPTASSSSSSSSSYASCEADLPASLGNEAYSYGVEPNSEATDVEAQGNETAQGKPFIDQEEKGALAVGGNLQPTLSGAKRKKSAELDSSDKTNDVDNDDSDDHDGPSEGMQKRVRFFMPATSV